MYVAPEITEIGTVRELTLGGQNGQNLDKDFPIHTPKDQLTFS